MPYESTPKTVLGPKLEARGSAWECNPGSDLGFHRLGLEPLVGVCFAKEQILSRPNNGECRCMGQVGALIWLFRKRT